MLFRSAKLQHRTTRRDSCDWRAQVFAAIGAGIPAACLRREEVAVSPRPVRRRKPGAARATWPRTAAHRPGAPEFDTKVTYDETLNLSIRKFLKIVGVNSQREIEHAVAKAVAGTETLAATMTLEIPALRFKVTFDGDIKLR